MNRRSFISSLLSGLMLSYQGRLAALEALSKASNPGKTGYVSDPVFLQHHIAPGHPETPNRLKFINKAMQASSFWGQLTQISLRPMSEHG